MYLYHFSISAARSMPKARSKTDRPGEDEQTDLERGRQWTSEETAALLELWATEKIQAMLDGPKRAAAHIEISEGLKLQGILRTADSVTKRMKYLRKRYKEIKDHNMQSGVERKSAPWYDDLDAILGPRPATEPRYTAQAGIEVETEISIDEDSDSDFEDINVHVADSLTADNVQSPGSRSPSSETDTANVPGTSTEGMFQVVCLFFH